MAGAQIESIAVRLPVPVRISDQQWPEGTVPVVSIFSWAYNHVRFIRESIESVLMQETTFPVEIIIHDDASQDGTADIIREYAGKYPHLFHNILHTENQWSQGRSVMIPLFTAPRGEFVALTHGDDYWTTPDKLEQQVAMLKENSDCQMSLHAVVDVDVDGKILSKPQQPRPEPGLIALGGFFRKECEHWQTGAFVLRQNFIARFPDWLNDLSFGDVPLLALASLRGPIGCIPGTHSAYRIHHDGFYSNTTLETDPTQSLKKTMRWDGEFAKMFRLLIQETDQPLYVRLFKAKAIEHVKSVIWSARLLRDYKQIRRSIRDAVVADPIGVLMDMTFWKNALFALAPWLDFKHPLHLQAFSDTLSNGRAHRQTVSVFRPD